MSKLILLVIGKKAKVVLDTSVGFRNWSRSLAFSTQVTEAVNPAVGCLYFLPDSRLPFQSQSINALWTVPNYTAWWQRHTGMNNWLIVDTQSYPDRESNPQYWVAVRWACATRHPLWHSININKPRILYVTICKRGLLPISLIVISFNVILRYSKAQAIIFNMNFAIYWSALYIIHNGANIIERLL